MIALIGLARRGGEGFDGAGTSSRLPAICLERANVRKSKRTPSGTRFESKLPEKKEKAKSTQSTRDASETGSRFAEWLSVGV